VAGDGLPVHYTIEDSSPAEIADEQLEWNVRIIVFLELAARQVLEEAKYRLLILHFVPRACRCLSGLH